MEIVCCREALLKCEVAEGQVIFRSLPSLTEDLRLAMAVLQKFIIQTSKTLHSNTGLEIYLRSSKSQIAFYADINNKPLPMASHSCTGLKEMMHKNQHRNVLQQRRMEESHSKKILAEHLRQEVQNKTVQEVNMLITFKIRLC